MKDFKSANWFNLSYREVQQTLANASLKDKSDKNQIANVQIIPEQEDEYQ